MLANKINTNTHKKTKLKNVSSHQQYRDTINKLTAHCKVFGKLYWAEGSIIKRLVNACFHRKLQLSWQISVGCYRWCFIATYSLQWHQQRCGGGRCLEQGLIDGTDGWQRRATSVFYVQQYYRVYILLLPPHCTTSSPVFDYRVEKACSDWGKWMWQIVWTSLCAWHLFSVFFFLFCCSYYGA